MATNDVQIARIDLALKAIEQNNDRLARALLNVVCRDYRKDHTNAVH